MLFDLLEALKKPNGGFFGGESMTSRDDRDFSLEFI